MWLISFFYHKIYVLIYMINMLFFAMKGCYNFSGLYFVFAEKEDIFVCFLLETKLDFYCIFALWFVAFPVRFRFGKLLQTCFGLTWVMLLICITSSITVADSVKKCNKKSITFISADLEISLFFFFHYCWYCTTTIFHTISAYLCILWGHEYIFTFLYYFKEIWTDVCPCHPFFIFLSFLLFHLFSLFITENYKYMHSFYLLFIFHM